MFLVCFIIPGLDTFAEQLCERKVKIYTDNTAAEYILGRGSAKESGQNQLAHVFWLRCVKLDTDVRIERVASENNIADDPSRERYVLMDAIGACRVSIISLHGGLHLCIVQVDGTLDTGCLALRDNVY